MQVQEKNNKGFSVIEVIVVLAIIAIISTVAYPNISHWNKARQINNSAIKIKTLFTNINSQVQRGNYGFVQIYINSTDTKVDVISKGMKTSTLAQKINGDTQFKNISQRCNTDDNDYWDDDGEIHRNPEVSKLELDKIATSFTGVGAVCFSKDGQWYSASKNLINGNVPITSIYICEKELVSCVTENDKGEIVINDEVEYLYAVSWSRFGNIKLEKYNSNRDEWINQ